MSPSRTDRPSALALTGLRKLYPGEPEVRAVDGIELEVARGELFGLLGPNGAGKTTTVGMCTTRIRPTEGRILVEGVDVVADPAAAKSVIGVVTQFNTLDRSLTLWENLYFHCLYFGWSTRESRERASSLLEQFRLAERAKAMPDEISGGMAQRLQVARSIAHRPAILFLDEPTAGLDPQSRIALWEIVEELRDGGMTVVLTTHYMEEADQLCERVAIIDHGRILVCDTPQHLKDQLGDQTVIDVRLAEEPGDLLDTLRALGGVDSVETVAGTGHTLRIVADGGNGLLPRVVDAAHARGLQDVSVTRSSLENVFINLTGRDLRE